MPGPEGPNDGLLSPENTTGDSESSERAGDKGLRLAGWYFRGYYTIWLLDVKRILGSVLGTNQGEPHRMFAE
jgi:hypothetical protein